MGAYAGPDGVESGLVLSLDAGNSKSYPGSGTAWTDLSGRGVIGTFNNMDGTNFNSANGGSLTFDGTNEFVQCSGSLTLTTATFIVWIRRNGNQTQYDGILFSRGTNVTGINFYDSVTLGYHWNGGAYQWNSGLTIPDLTWCMCAISQSGSSGTAYLCQSSGITSSTNSGSVTSTTLDDIKVGQDDFGGRFFNGNIAQALIYNRALTATEIQQNFNATKSRYF